MSDDSRGIPPNKRTVEIYRDLLQVEVRALVSRVSELTQTVGALFGEVSSIAVQLEDSVNGMDRMSNSLSYCREEISLIKKTLSGLNIADIRNRVERAEEKLKEIQNQLDGDE